jgi:ectoine hydroxylase-related dioxygenase (phytanoyl-CoA dioxygenase family)
MLSEEQKARYREDGFIIVPDVLTEAECVELRRVTEGFVERSRAVSTHTDIFDLEDGHTAERPRLRRIKNPDLHHPAYARLVRHPKIVEVLRDLWGPNIRFDLSKLNLKAAGFGSPVEWHQDWAFYPHTNDDLAAVGIMIDDIDLDNGPMLVVPGSHKGPIYDHHAKGVFVGGIDAAILDPALLARAVPCTGKAGSITVHHVRALHGSAPNRSSKPRRFLLHQYRAADAWPLMGFPDFDKFNALMVAGEWSVEPRVEKVPVRLPLPPAGNQGSIYENQRDLAHRYFDDAGDEKKAAAT